jgi:hypothetical protein
MENNNQGGTTMSLLTATRIEIRERKYSNDPRSYNSKPRTYIFPKGETIIENLFVGRRNRPIDLYRSDILPAVADELARYARTVKGMEHVQPEDFKFNWSQKAGCSCGCSPAFIVTGPWVGNVDIFVDAEATVPDAAAVTSEAFGALEALRESQAEAKASSQQTGRSGSGNLRNFKAMSDDKFNDVSATIRSEANDPEAIEAINAEYNRRNF